MRLAFAAAAALIAVATPLSAQDAAPEAPAITPMAIAFDEDGLRGAGGDILVAELPKSQFVVIGEDHGYADAPRLVSAFAAEGRELGFDDYAIEVGPYSTAWLRDVLAEGGPDALARELQGRPLAIPFLSLREEAEAAMGFLEEGHLWGADQEFIGSPLIHFDQLSGGSDPELVADLARREREAFAIGNQGAVFMVSVTDAEWAALYASFAENQDALARLKELRRSAAVYAHNFTGRGLENNLDRVALIREYFLNAYRKAEAREGAPPRVIMKFGAVHASRATTPMKTFDVGALVEGMAANNGMEALHVAYLPLGGEQIGVRPSPDGVFSVRQTDGEKLRAVLESAGVDLSVINPGSGHHLIALDPVKRALGNKGLNELDGITRAFLIGFDYLVTTMDAKAGTPLANR